MPERLAHAQHVYRFFPERFGARCRSQDDRPATVGDEAAIAHRERIADHARLQYLLDRERLFFPRDRVHQCPFTSRDRDLGKLLACGAELMHVARPGERVGRGRQEGLVGCFVVVVLARACRGAAYAALGAAVRNQRDFTQPGLDRTLRVRDVRHERRAADDGAIEVIGLQPQILGKRQRRQAYLRGRAENSVDVGELEPAIVERAHRGLRHHVDRAGMRRHLAEIGLGGADDCNTTAFEAAHFAPPTGTNTGNGGCLSSPGLNRTLTRMPILTCIGSMSSTRLIMRNPSSMSISTTLCGGLSLATLTTVVECTVPRPLETRHSRLVLPVLGATTRGKNTGVLSSVHTW